MNSREPSRKSRQSLNTIFRNSGQLIKIFMRIFGLTLHSFFFPFSRASLAELCSFWCSFKDLFTSVVQVRWQWSPSPLKLMTSQVVEGMWFCMGHSGVNGLKYIVLFSWVNMEEVGGGGCCGDYAHLACLGNQ